MGLNLSNKLLNKSEILCGENFFVTLALSAAPDIQENPVDIVLVLDRSGSMTGLPLSEVKKAAKIFVDIIDTATDGGANGIIGNGSNIGMVSFATEATKNVSLTTNVAELKTAIDILVAGGNTNHSDAFKKAIETFNPLSQNEKVIIMFTDGTTTIGPNPNILAQQAKDAGITIYCIGLTGANGVDVNALNQWASDPDSTHVSITPDLNDLENVFEELANNITKPGATNIVVDEVLNDDFSIVEIMMPTKGNASLVNNTTLKWTINELGKRASENATLTFEVKYLGNSSKITEVNKSITYSDDEGNIANFQNPKITINCGSIYSVDPCPDPQTVTFDVYQDYLEFDLGNYVLDNLGRILELSLTLKNICPNKKVALAITLNEVDNLGKENKKGMKIISIPAHSGKSCEDIKVKNIKFILPEEDGLLCAQKQYKVRVIANYINNNSIC